MNKSELVDATTIQVEIIPKKTVSEVIDRMIDVVRGELSRGGDVRVPGLGKFTTGHREATTKRNPRTGEPLHIAAKTVVKFKPEKGLREAVDTPQRKVGAQRISPMEVRKLA